jgi:hypothetical protein
LKERANNLVPKIKRASKLDLKTDCQHFIRNDPFIVFSRKSPEFQAFDENKSMARVKHIQPC